MTELTENVQTTPGQEKEAADEPQLTLNLNLNHADARAEDKQEGGGFSPISSPKLEAAMNRLYENIERELNGF